MELNTQWEIFEATLEKVCSWWIDKWKLTEDAVSILEEVNKLGQKNIDRNESKIGLVYWKVQSGKTNAMIASTALAFDNGYKIAIIMTSNNIELVEQTATRLRSKISGISNIIETYKYQDLKTGNHFAVNALLQDDVRIVIVAAKGSVSLDNVITFLEKLDKKSKAIIFDDEGDNYSLDNNRNARDKDEDIAPTKINDLIFSRLRNKVDHVLVSVTWTPQWVLLEWTNESLWFKFILEPWDAYIWWETFFDDDFSEDNSYISIIDPEEVKQVDETKIVSDSLEDALMNFYVVSTLYLVETWKYSEFLCHPHQTTKYHKSFKEAIEAFHNSLIIKLQEWDISVMKSFEDMFNQKKLKTGKIKYFDQFQKLLKTNILKTRILLMNSKQKDSMIPERHHILIWGNILWRGVTIENMLVMYYGRNAKSTNMDTLYQHARMFWYRRPMLDFMHIYMPEQIYAKFHATYETDEWLRNMVKRNPYNTFPIKFYDNSTGLKLTRKQIESKDFLWDVFVPRRQFYPNHISQELHEKNATKYEKLEQIIRSMNWKSVPLEDVVIILSQIKTSSKNQWKWNRPIAILKGLLEDERIKEVKVTTNNAETRSWKDGQIWTGTLDGTRIEEMRKENCISICFSSFAYKNKPELGKIWYPTMVFPERMDGIGKVYITKK